MRRDFVKVRGSYLAAVGTLGVLVVATTPAYCNTLSSQRLEDLFRGADVVAVVRVLSGDGEDYEPTVYKARVLKALKGPASGATIYFGPYESYGIGSRYLVFLKKSRQSLMPKPTSQGNGYGRIADFYEGMYSGFGIMKIEYVCVFGEQDCGYGVELNSRQVVLPKGIKLYPQEEPDSHMDNRWVHEDVLVGFLVNLSALSRD
jgi:hypothetical protein